MLGLPAFAESGTPEETLIEKQYWQNLTKDLIVLITVETTFVERSFSSV